MHDALHTAAQRHEPHRLALWFRVYNGMKYLSHRDMMTLWSRALARCRIPVRYSRGFNPHPQLSLPLPRNVGMDSDRELVVVRLEKEIPIEPLRDQFQSMTPQGIDMQDVSSLPADASPQPIWARYALALTGAADTETVDQKIATFTTAGTWPIHRQNGKTIDLKSHVQSLCRHDSSLLFILQIGTGATPRIDEVRALLGIEAMNCVSQIRRTAVGYPPGVDHSALTEIKSTSGENCK